MIRMPDELVRKYKTVLTDARIAPEEWREYLKVLSEDAEDLTEALRPVGTPVIPRPARGTRTGAGGSGSGVPFEDLAIAQ